MSMFLIATAGSVITAPFHLGVETNNDLRDSAQRRDSEFGVMDHSFLWPRAQWLGSLGNADMTPTWIGSNPVYFSVEIRWQGQHNRKKFSGTTKDLNGDVLPGCTVDLFRTRDDLFIATVVSDTIGYYEVYSPHDTVHYLVAYKAGAQDVAGTTVNTILGS